MKTTTTKKAAAKTALINASFKFGIRKGANGTLVKSFSAGRAPSLKAYPTLVNMTSAGARTATVILKVKNQHIWASANKVTLA